VFTLGKKKRVALLWGGRKKRRLPGISNRPSNQSISAPYIGFEQGLQGGKKGVADSCILQTKEKGAFTDEVTVTSLPKESHEKQGGGRHRDRERG